MIHYHKFYYINDIIYITWTFVVLIKIISQKTDELYLDYISFY